MSDILVNSKKRIVVLGTGGTIAGTGKEGETVGYDSAQIKVDKLVEEIPSLESIADVTSVELFSVDSCDIDFEKLVKIASYINEKSMDDSVDGFVITHGTDTLEETAYFLNLTLKTSKPVVITGSMRPSTAMSADGPFNLYQAVSLAANDDARGKGVLVAFCDAIYGARDVTKINTFKTDAFSHKDLGCLGYMRDNKVFFYNNSVKSHTEDSEFSVESADKLPRVEVVNFYLGADKEVLECVSRRADGIVLGGAGCGGSSTEWDEKIEEIMARGIPVVRSSRICNGLVTYSESEIEKNGIYANNLSPQKARILLMLALTETYDVYEIQKMFNKY